MQLFIVFCFSFVSAAAVFTSNGIAIIRPHRSTTYVDAAYCYRWSSVVCQSVCVSRSSLCDIAVFVLKRDVKFKPNFVSRLWALQKRLNRSRCRLGCGLRWVRGSTC